jgi:hypothetical protein
MRKIKQLMVLILSILTINTCLAQSVTIGPISGASSYQTGPIYQRVTAQTAKYSKSAYLYTKDELNIPSGSTITKVEWLKANNATATGNNKFNVIISNTSKTTMGTSANYSEFLQNSQTVFSTDKMEFPATTNYWIPCPFSSGFIYEGGSLSILTDWAKVGTCVGPLTFYQKASVGKAIQVTSPVLIPQDALLLPTSGSLKPTIRITYTAPNMCSTLPNTGLAVSTNNVVCPNQQFTLSLTNKIAEGGISYDWQKSNSLSFNDAASIGNSSSVITSQTTETYYRCKVSCGSLVTYTNIIKIPINPFYNCYCPSTAQSPTDEEITHFKLGNLDKKSSVGTSVIFGVRAGDCGDLAPGEGSKKSLYSNYRDDKPTDIEIGSSVPFIVETSLCGTNGAYNRAAIFIDINRNGIFDDSEQIYLSPVVYGPTANVRKGFIKIPVTSQPGITGVRVIVNETQNAISACGSYSFGETEDYTINLVSDVNCDNTPTLISSDTKVCKGRSLLLYPSITGDSYQWIKNGQVVSGSTDFFYEPVVSEPTTFICKVKCGDVLKETESILIDLNKFTDCYCESGAGGQADEEIIDFTLNGVKVGLDCGKQAPGAKSYLNEYSDFKPNGSFTTLKKGSTYSFDIYDNDCDIPASPYYTASVGGWIDFNQNGVFDDNEKVLQVDGVTGPKHITGTITIPLNVMPGVTCLRLVLGGGLYGIYLTPCSKFQSGETEDHLVTITD